MRQDGDRDGDADACRGLEADAEREPIHEAVRGEAAGTRPAALLRRPFVVVHQEQAVDDGVGEEADGRDGQERLGPVSAAAEPQRFGQEVEEGECDHRPGAERQDHIQPVLEAQGGQSAEKGGAKGAQRNG